MMATAKKGDSGKGNKDRSKIERHHQLPRQFDEEFDSVGLDIEDHVIDLPKDKHRLKPEGLHTGKDNWNKQWVDFFKKLRGDFTKEDILAQLEKMRKHFGLEDK
jgi:hypothetical protein